MQGNHHELSNTLQEFHAFKPQGKQTLYHGNHIVQRLTSSTIDSAAKVYICTIQRMYSTVSGKQIDESSPKPLPQVARDLLTALDPDAINQRALVNAKAAGITRKEEPLTDSDVKMLKSSLSTIST